MAEEFFAIFGLIGMLVMIGLGVYAMVTAKKPEDEKRISQGRFSLSAKLRRKLEEMRTRVTGKSAKRRGRGIALLVTCLIPVLLSVGLADMFLTESLIFAGVVGMFAMIALGVYEIVTASGESKTMSKLLGGE